VVCIASSLLAVRMYGSAAQMREGFRKNLYPLLGGRRLPLAAALVLLSVAWLYPVAGAFGGSAGALVPLAMLAALRIAGVLLFRHGWGTVLLHPVGVLAAAALAVESWMVHERGAVTWRGRRLPSAGAGRLADGAGEGPVLRAQAAFPERSGS
jgi:hypothetical protein